MRCQPCPGTLGPPLSHHRPLPATPLRHTSPPLPQTHSTTGVPAHSDGAISILCKLSLRHIAPQQPGPRATNATNANHPRRAAGEISTTHAHLLGACHVSPPYMYPCPWRWAELSWAGHSWAESRDVGAVTMCGRNDGAVIALVDIPRAVGIQGPCSCIRLMYEPDMLSHTVQYVYSSCGV